MAGRTYGSTHLDMRMDETRIRWLKAESQEVSRETPSFTRLVRARTQRASTLACVSIETHNNKTGLRKRSYVFEYAFAPGLRASIQFSYASIH